jgi:hypothetical protein
MLVSKEARELSKLSEIEKEHVQNTIKSQTHASFAESTQGSVKSHAHFFLLFEKSKVQSIQGYALWLNDTRFGKVTVHISFFP